MASLANSENSENIIEVKDLGFAYKLSDGSDKAVLHNMSFDIKKGSFTAVIGHNGSGKSTLSKLLCGMLVPTSGEVTVKCAGTEYRTDDEEHFYDIRKSFGMVFQNPDNQLVATVVEEDVAFAPENMGVEPAEIRRRVDEALDIVGLREYALHDTHKLSGGQKQKLAIAGILAMLPECIIFDESTAMLDPKGREDVMRTILRLRDEMGITVILITHYMNEAAKADRILVIDEGRLLCDGTPREVFAKDEMLYGAGLEAPQSSNLVKRLASAGAPIKRTVLNPEEAAEELLPLIKRETPQ